MENRDLEKQKDRAKKELGDYQSTAENIIDKLVSEIESLEDDKEKLKSEIADAENIIDELKAALAGYGQ